MKNKLILGLIVSALAFTSISSAFAPKETAQYFNGPTVSNITNSSATVSLSERVQRDITEEEKAGVYFEYFETHQICIMIYPTPVECLPKKTTVGSTTAVLTGLKANTSYTVKYKKDNTIRCITTPCPENGFESLSVEFVTKGDGSATTTPPVTPTPTSTQVTITKTLFLGMRNAEVTMLQNFLSERGFFSGTATGFYGVKTMKAVQTFQRMNNITPTGFVGPLTRASILKATTPATGETFEGKVEAFSTSCFADGICSVTVGGKVVVTTRGWARDPVGQLRGVESIGEVENKIGHNAKVYAAKTEDGNYTLYGNTSFYVEIQ